MPLGSSVSYEIDRLSRAVLLPLIENGERTIAIGGIIAKLDGFADQCAVDFVKAGIEGNCAISFDLAKGLVQELSIEPILAFGKAQPIHRSTPLGQRRFVVDPTVRGLMIFILDPAMQAIIKFLQGSRFLFFENE